MALVRRKYLAAYSLIEMVVYIGITGLVIVSATLFAAEFMFTASKVGVQEEVARNARYAIGRIGAEIREAADLNVGSSVFGSNPGTLSLATSSGATNPTIIDVSGGALRVKRGAGAAAAVTGLKVTVTEFTVENLSTVGKTKAVRVHLKLQSVNPSLLQEQKAEITVETTVRIPVNDGFAN